ncbi:MAG: J domain-containing protein [Actinobacteria bacterium]|nr:J domain-containing protein [Actinomycetota bacterium]
MPTGPDHYRTLGVSQNASAQQIRNAHRALARLHHPDLVTDPAERGRAERRMAAINGAWHVLGDPVRREEYDGLHRSPAPRQRPPTAPEPEYRSDAFQGVAVSPVAGCALRLGPVVLTVGVLFAILIVTALMAGDGNRPPNFQVGQCVRIAADSMAVVPCTGTEAKIVARGVAGTSCPTGAVAVVLPTRTEQVCVLPAGG